MREIEFRGKRSNANEWIYGNLVKAENGICIFPIEKEMNIGRHIRQIESSPYWVIPETIGQYTGLKDKNGVKIFEGDNFKTLHYERMRTYKQKASCHFWKWGF